VNGITDIRRGGGRGGITLIEMMIALAILGIALTAIFSSFSFQQKSYVTQNAVAQLQQSVRGGMQFMEEDLRNAANIPSTNIAVPATLFGGSPLPAVLTNGMKVTDGGTNGLDNLYVISRTGMDNVLANAAVAAETVTVVDNTTLWTAGDVGVVYDAANADIFIVTAFQPVTAQLTHSAFTYNYLAGARIGRLRYSEHFINNSNPTRPVLMRRYLDNTGAFVSDVVADDIEDLQVRLGVFDNVAGTITFMDGVGLTNAQLRNVRQVKVQIVGRASVADPTWNEGPYYNTVDFNRTGGIAGFTQHRRRPLLEIIQIRNAGILP
jgi:prepilin-type N-terminal cleavage/methylation domain-containing protein